MTPQFCTIVARNYLSQARILAASLAEHHPGAPVSVLVIDGELGGFDPGTEPFEILVVSDLQGDQVELRRMVSLYDILEYATALKPWLLTTLLARRAGPVVYLDPDIWVFAPLDDLAALAESQEAVLTPHASAPIPRDGKSISEHAILSAGVYNLGFVAVGARSSRFLAFWAERLLRDCVVDPLGMRFVDQRWMDLAPGMFDIAIVRDPSCNVAYWNLDHRALTWTGERYEIDGMPLRFFHFSGYHPEVPHLLSHHQGERPRILLSEHPDLRRLCNAYGERLIAERAQAPLPAYGWARTTNGLEIDLFMRAVVRASVRQADLGLEAYPPDPWAPAGDGAFVDWLRAPAVYGRRVGRLNRYLATVHAMRGDLQQTFPDPEGADYAPYMSWARRQVREGTLSGRLGMGTPSAEQRGDGESSETDPQPGWAPPDQLRAGFTVAGYLRAELGTGEAARLTIAALDAAGLPHATVVNDDTPSRQDHPFELSELQRGAYDINLICVNADRLPAFNHTMGPGFFDGRYNIGQWAWELENFPEAWSGAFDMVHEVWAISEFVRAALAKATDKPVFAAPLPVLAPVAPPDIGRRQLGLPDGRFLFLFCFDLLSILERKNPLGLVDAFRRAFPSGEGPLLVVKALNGELKVQDLERLRVAVSGREDIRIVEGYLSAGEQAALMATADCYVSLHRSEGFGLTMAEAMALGKPVIATAYSGNLDFMDDDTGYLVPWSPGAVPPGCEPYQAGAMWAEPDLDVAAGLMRRVYEHPDEAAALGHRARRSIQASHGPAARARFVRSRFEAIQEMRAESIRRSADGDAGRQEAGPGRRAARRVIRRWPEVERAHCALTRAQTYLRRVAAGEEDRRLSQVIERTARLDADIVAAKQMQSARGSAVDHSFDTVRLGMAQLRDSIVALQRGLGDVRSGPVAEAQAGIVELRQSARRLQHGLDDLRSGPVAEAQVGMAELHAVPYTSDPAVLMTTDDAGRPAIGYRADRARPSDDKGYAAFEDLFRGTEELITERQRFYLPLLIDSSPVVDVGCGRGEMLAELDRLGVEAVGADLDESMVARCRKRGLDVEHADAVGYLAARPDASVGAIFCAQVIEHLGYEALLGLLTQALRVLVPGGALIAETVNPHSIAAFRAFWTDPSHRTPLFPEVMAALCRDAGFDEAIVVWPNGTGTLDLDRSQQGEYAIVARRRRA